VLRNRFNFTCFNCICYCSLIIITVMELLSTIIFSKNRYISGIASYSYLEGTWIESLVSAVSVLKFSLSLTLRGCIQKFPDWPPGARTANIISFCHYVQSYRYFVSQSSEFYRHKPFCCFSKSVYFCCYFVMTQCGNFWIHPRK
jgi:hypothetical protein